MVAFASCSGIDNGNSKEMQAKMDSMQNVLKTISDDSLTLEKHLTTFDTLGFCDIQWTTMGSFS